MFVRQYLENNLGLAELHMVMVVPSAGYCKLHTVDLASHCCNSDLVVGMARERQEAGIDSQVVQLCLGCLDRH